MYILKHSSIGVSGHSLRECVNLHTQKFIILAQS